MSLELFDEVLVATDRFDGTGIRRGMKATIVDVYEDGAFEIQVHNPEGDLDLVEANAEDLEQASLNEDDPDQSAPEVE